MATKLQICNWILFAFQLLSNRRNRFLDCIEMHFATFLSGGFTTMAVINPLERDLAKCTFVDWSALSIYFIFPVSFPVDLLLP